jgi:TRAP-type transport system small permease protein
MSTLARGNDLPPPTGTVEVVQAALGRLYDTMIAIACVLLGLMVLSITTDVLLRNVALPGFPRGFAASNDFSEYSLYLCTLLAAPGLLRAGQHIRVDILLQAMPPRLAWTCEWVSDVLALAGCTAVTWMGVVMTAESYSSGAMQTKSLVVPEWCLLAPLPVAFALLGIEFGLRMWRLAHGPRGPRADAVSAA